jgi:MFS family permease
MTNRNGEGAKAFSWRFTAPLFMGSALNPVNSSLIATALVPIARSLNVSVGQTSVLVAVLYLASSVAQPTAGKLAEEFGPRRIFLIGIVLVLAGGLVGGFAPKLSVLVAARVLIGIGTSAGYPTAMVLVRRRAESAGMERPPGGVLGGLSIAGQVTAAVGLPIGGFLVAGLGWQSTFFINVPLAIIALVMALIWIPKDARPAEPRKARQFLSRIDLTGILGFAAMMTALLVFLLSLPNPSWVFLAVAVVIGVGLVLWELRASNPFLDVRLLVTNLALTRTYLRIGLTLLIVYTVMYGLTQWLEAGHGFSSSQAGLLVLPMTALAAIVSIPVSRRHLIRGPLLFAAGAALAGSLGMLFMTTSTSIFLIIGVTLVFGVTIGTTAVGNQTALYEAGPPSQLGTAAGLFRTFGYIGSIASSAIISGVFRASVDDSGLHTIAIILISISVVVLLMTLLDRRLRSSTKQIA